MPAHKKSYEHLFDYIVQAHDDFVHFANQTVLDLLKALYSLPQLFSFNRCACR